MLNKLEVIQCYYELRTSEPQCLEHSMVSKQTTRQITINCFTCHTVK